MSRALASRICGVRASSASAIARSAASLVPVGSVARVREASRAARHRSATDGTADCVGVAVATGWAVVAIHLLHQDEVVTVHGLLGGARQDLAHLGALHAHDTAQLGGRVVADALADDRAALGHVD